MAMLAHQWFESLRPQSGRNFKTFEGIFNSAMFFDCGNLGSLPDADDAFVGIARSPFDLCVLQFQMGQHSNISHWMILWCSKDRQDPWLMYSFKERATGQWKTSDLISVKSEFNCVTGFEHLDGVAIEPSNSYNEAMSVYIAQCFFNVLSCSNVKTIDNAAPAALNKKRERNGKLPLVSYKTLEIVLDRARTSRRDAGGTHASPGVHVRRGHIRRLSEEKRTWVNPCLVGSTHRLVLKDYKVRPSAGM